jgi:hypothetical protein
MLNDRVFDHGLTALILEVTALYICDVQPADYTEATVDKSYGVKSSPFVAGPQISDVTPGRKVVVQAFTDGVITRDGTVGFWALVDDTNQRLLASAALSAPKDIVMGNTFSLPDFDIVLPYEAVTP